MRGLVITAFAILVATVAATARADKPSSSPAELRATATHVVVGKVVGVYGRIETEGDWKYTRYLAEIRVSDCEKGGRIDSGDLVYARYWRRQWVGEGNAPPDTSGHGGIPRANDTVRVSLARNAYDGFTNDNNDGGYNVIGPNGFEKVTPDPGE